MMVLSELRGTYWGADSTCKLFERAQAKLRNHQTETTPTNKAGVPIDVHLASDTGKQTERRWTDAQTYPESFISLDDLFHEFAMTTGELGTVFGLNPEYKGDESSIDVNNKSSRDETMNVEDGLNSLLSLEQFNVQCLEMAQPRHREYSG